MEPVNRLIIGNNVYDINDDLLEQEVTAYYNELDIKEKTAKEGKAAIKTAVQDKTGETITTDTYAEFTDKINNFKKTTFEIPELNIGYLSSSGFSQIIDGNNIVSLSTSTARVEGNVPAYIILNRNIFPRLTNSDTPFKIVIGAQLAYNNSSPMTGVSLFSMANLDYGSEVADTNSEMIFGIRTVSSTSIRFSYTTYDGTWNYRTYNVSNISNYFYYKLEMSHTSGSTINYKLYGAPRIEARTTSGYIPGSWTLVLSIDADSPYGIECLESEDNICLYIGGLMDRLNLPDTATLKTAEVYLPDTYLYYKPEDKAALIINPDKSIYYNN